MKSAVSTACLYPMLTERAFGELLEDGIDTFEIFFNSDSEISLPYIRQLKNMAGGYAAAVYSVHPHTSGFEPMMFFSDYKRRFFDSLEKYKHIFEAAGELGAKIVVFHGDRYESRLNEREYFDRFCLLSETAETQGLVLAQENVSRCRSRTPGFVKSMRKYLGGKRAKFAFDIKQAIRSGINPFDMIGAMGPDIVNVHLSDSDDISDCLLPGNGKADLKGIAETLASYGYAGPIIIEVYRSCFCSINELIESSDYLNNILNKPVTLNKE